MKRILLTCLCLLLLTTSSCGSLQAVKDNPTAKQSIVTLTQVGLTTLDWLKATMDGWFASRCATGEASQSACANYTIFSALAKSVLTTAINSLQNYLAAPTDLNLAILQTSQEHVNETIAKLDMIYKDPKSIQ